jgi:malate/lactate dehydrogenase
MGPANAVKDHLRDWYFGTPLNDFVSMAVIADGKSYGVPSGICYSLPVETKNFQYKVVNEIDIDDFTKNKIEKSTQEIRKELSEIGFYI